MDYNAHMNYDELSGTSILLLGKTRSLQFSEFETLLRLHAITLCSKFEEGVSLIIEGRLMNPLEQDESARLYEMGAAPMVSIDTIEKWLCGSIEPNRLLMSLKLSRDQHRLVDFIQNRYITDELFFKLLKLYDWQGEGLFDNDTNRDVTAALISRFYQEIERNHNVQYAMSGLAHLIEKYGTAQLIDAISELSPIVRELQSPMDRSLSGVLDAMALHPQTSEKLLGLLIRERSALLARRIPMALESQLLALKNDTVDQHLARNKTLSAQGAERLQERYPDLIAQFFPLSEERFDRLLDAHSTALASNTTLTAAMQQRLMDLEQVNVNRALASNPSILPELLTRLYDSGEYYAEIASNPAATKEQCEALWISHDPAVLHSLAANVSTPIEILYQLALDSRYERSVKTNAAFGKHIQTHNIGWQV